MGSTDSHTIITAMGIKLVIVDDAPFIREVIRQMLANTDIVVAGEAGSGDEGVELAKKLNPDVVLMDIVMPNKSGIDACKEILAACPDIRVVALTTLDQETLIMRAIEAGCCNYVTKPFKAENLIKVIKSVGGK